MATNNNTTTAAELSAKWESQLKRNPHPDFKKVEASRPPWDLSSKFRYTQTVNPSWTFGDGPNGLDAATDAGKAGKAAEEGKETPGHVAIDPYAPGRPVGFNYKLLISTVIPRPIAFLSTRGVAEDGTTEVINLAPFSYFQVIGHDPPLFMIGFACAAERGRSKDSLRNLIDTRECVVNIIGEDFVEAANATSVNAPFGVSEWDVSGLTPLRDCETVSVPRVKEAVFSIEAKLESVREFGSKSHPGSVSATMVVIEGTRFWAREDAVNEELNLIDPAVWVLTFFFYFVFVYVCVCFADKKGGETGAAPDW